jgi:hypothetical protein
MLSSLGSPRPLWWIERSRSAGNDPNVPGCLDRSAVGPRFLTRAVEMGAQVQMLTMCRLIGFDRRAVQVGA